MPLVFAAHAGSLLALTGTPVNVLVSEAAAEAGLAPFGFFEFAIVGVPLLLGTIAIVLLFGQRLLPERSGRMIPPDLSKHARTLVEQYRLDHGLFQLRVGSHSPYVGSPPTVVDLADYPGLTLVTILAGDASGPLRRPTLAEGDILIVRGDAETVGGLASDKLLALGSADAPTQVADTLFSRTSGLAEVVIPPRSGLIGQPVFPGMVTPSGDLVILAVQRRGEDLGETVLAAGDTLLLQGTWKALDEHLDDPDVLVVDSPDLVRRQAVPMGMGAKQAIAVLLAMVLLLATGMVPSVIAGLLAACAMVLLRVLTVEQAYRAVNWTTVILVGAMIPLSTAMETTGAAKLMAATAGPRDRQRQSVRPARRPIRVDSHPRSAHQQHSDGAHYHPDRCCDRRRDRGVGATRSDERRDRGGSRVPHPRRDPCQSDGDGPGGLPVRRLLEARAAVNAAFLRGGDLPRPGVLALLIRAR